MLAMVHYMMLWVGARVVRELFTGCHDIDISIYLPLAISQLSIFSVGFPDSFLGYFLVPMYSTG
jgi:hypothetical protein